MTNFNFAVIFLTDGRRIEYYYSGAGELIKTEYFSAAGQQLERWEYIGDLVLRNGALFQVAVPDGRAVFANGTGNYELHYTDHLGNVRASINRQGQLISSSHFDPWGHRLQGLGTTATQLTNRWELQGKERDLTFGLNRINFGARVYNPTIGVWDQVDPLGDERVWVSPYNFNQNNPINRIDPTGALDEPIYKKAWNYVSSFFSGSNATRNTQSVAATTSYTLVKSQEVRTEYVTRVSSLDKTDSQGRTHAKMEARAKTPAVMREVAEQMRPSSGESTRVGGTASKTNAGVNNMVGTLGKVGKVAGVTAIGVSVYNVATAENKPQAVATEGGALVGAIAGGELGAETGAAIGVWFGGAGAVPGAIIGGIIGSIGGGIIGANAGTSTYNAITTKKDDKR